MNSAEKKLFISKLEKDSDEELAKTLNYYRNNSDLDLLPNILDILSSDRSDSIKDTVLQLCIDIKTADTAYTVFDYITECESAEARRMLLSVIWQNGQDLSLRASQIVEMLIREEDFETAFDCLTILENCTDNIPADKAAELIEKIDSKADKCHKSVEPLLGSAKEHLANAITSAE